jgi:Flp pilus assembly protein TadG
MRDLMRFLRNDYGQAFVELALILPLFIVLLVGAAELGRLAYASIEVANAARAGVAYAAQSHITASDNAGIQLAATQDAPDIVTTWTVDVTQSCTCTDGTHITCSDWATRCASPFRILEYVQVNTAAPVDTLFHLPGIPNQVTMRGQAVMRVEQ